MCTCVSMPVWEGCVCVWGGDGIQIFIQFHLEFEIYFHCAAQTKNSSRAVQGLLRQERTIKCFSYFNCAFYINWPGKNSNSLQKEFSLSTILQLIFAASDKFPNEKSPGDVLTLPSPHKCIWSSNETFLNSETALNSPLKKSVPGRPIYD